MRGRWPAGERASKFQATLHLLSDRASAHAPLKTYSLLLILAGSLILAWLMQLPERLDALLLVSNAIANLIGGLSRLSMGILQLGSVIAVALLALMALLLLVGGGVRLARAITARPRRPF